MMTEYVTAVYWFFFVKAMSKRAIISKFHTIIHTDQFDALNTLKLHEDSFATGKEFFTMKIKWHSWGIESSTNFRMPFHSSHRSRIRLHDVGFSLSVALATYQSCYSKLYVKFALWKLDKFRLTLGRSSTAQSYRPLSLSLRRRNLHWSRQPPPRDT